MIGEIEMKKIQFTKKQAEIIVEALEAEKNYKKVALEFGYLPTGKEKAKKI